MAPFSWPVQAIGRLPEAARPGVFVALVVLLVWVPLHGDVPGLWRALCRGVARAVDLLVGVPLRLEYAITTARRRRKKAPPHWAFVIAPVADGVQDGAAWLYARHQHGVADPIEEDDDEDDEQDAPAAVPPRTTRKRTRVLLLCAVIVAGLTVAWSTMDGLAPTSIAKYRLAQAFEPWRSIEAWAGVDPGRGGRPVLVRARRRRTLLRVRVACRAAQRCRGWVLLKKRSGTVVAVHALDLKPGSTLVALRLTRKQAHAAHGGRVVVERL